MKLEARKYLYDIQSAAGLLREFTDGKTLADYEGDAMLRSAVDCFQHFTLRNLLTDDVRIHGQIVSVGERLPKGSSGDQFLQSCAHFGTPLIPSSGDYLVVGSLQLFSTDRNLAHR